MQKIMSPKCTKEGKDKTNDNSTYCPHYNKSFNDDIDHLYNAHTHFPIEFVNTFV